MPGILGSALSYGRADDLTLQPIWGESITANYRRLLRNPGLLQWTGTAADARFIESYTYFRQPVFRFHIWHRTVYALEQAARRNATPIVKYGYDWRESISSTAARLGQELAPTSKEKTRSGRLRVETKLILVGHSMGGLVVLAALGLGAIKPEQVDRIVLLGVPCTGAPAAFGAAYANDHIPLLKEISGILNRNRNAPAFFQMLYGCIRTFPSLYELLPNEPCEYLFDAPGRHFNPLSASVPDCLDEKTRAATRATHALIAKGVSELTDSGVRAQSIFVDHHPRRPTPLEYRVASRGSGSGYDVLECIRSQYGDGTVPRESAGHVPGSAVANVDHASMPNDSNVVSILKTFF